MKIRTGFVSNSSSASFVIDKCNLTDKQIKCIRSAPAYAERLEMGFIGSYGNWQVKENDRFIWGDTTMDNFDFAEFFTKIGIPWTYIGWSDSNGNDRSKMWSERASKGEFKVVDANRRMYE